MQAHVAAYHHEVAAHSYGSTVLHQIVISPPLTDDMISPYLSPIVAA
jgi:hypothetical protein